MLCAPGFGCRSREKEVYGGSLKFITYLGDIHRGFKFVLGQGGDETVGNRGVSDLESGSYRYIAKVNWKVVLLSCVY